MIVLGGLYQKDVEGTQLSTKTLFGCKTNSEILLQAEEIRLLKTKKAFQRAYELANELIGSYPQNAECYFLRGSLYRAQRKYDETIDDYTRGLDLDGSCAINYHTRGFCAIQAGDYDTAINDFSKIIDDESLLQREYILEESFAFRTIVECCVGQWDAAFRDIDNVREDFKIYMRCTNGEICKDRLSECIHKRILLS